MSPTPSLDAKPSVKNGGAKKDTSGPAFPVNLPTPVLNALLKEGALSLTHGLQGMTLRDFFATQVLVTQAERTAYNQITRPTAETRFEHWLEADAAIRYMKADAMLKARAAK